MLAEELLNLSKKRSIVDVEVYQVQSYSRPMTFSANNLKQIETAQTNATAIRLWQNGKPGLAVAYGDFNPDDLISQALCVAELNPPEDVFLNSANTLIYPTINNDEPDLNFLMEQGKSAIALIREKYSEVMVNLDLEWERETTTLINSRGLYCQQTDISNSVSLGVEWFRDEDFLGIYDGEYSHENLDLSRVINSILQRLKWAKKNSKIKSGNTPVLFTPNSSVILWETVTEALNGKRILDKSSPWSECQNQRVISPRLTLTQQPDFKPYDCPFDDEGTVTQTLTLISEGKLNSFYGDKKTAHQLGIPEKGNGFRASLGSYPTPDLVNLVISKGNKSFKELIDSLDYGIIVDQILGDGGDISGDFSFNVDLGYLVKKGEVVGRVKDVMLAGNIYQALDNLKYLGCDRTWSGSCYTPSVVIEQLSLVSD